jgi:hypothetical protein
MVRTPQDWANLAAAVPEPGAMPLGAALRIAAEAAQAPATRGDPFRFL